MFGAISISLTRCDTMIRTMCALRNAAIPGHRGISSNTTYVYSSPKYLLLSSALLPYDVLIHSGWKGCQWLIVLVPGCMPRYTKLRQRRYQGSTAGVAQCHVRWDSSFVAARFSRAAVGQSSGHCLSAATATAIVRVLPGPVDAEACV